MQKLEQNYRLNVSGNKSARKWRRLCYGIPRQREFICSLSVIARALLLIARSNPPHYAGDCFDGRFAHRLAMAIWRSPFRIIEKKAHAQAKILILFWKIYHVNTRN